MVVVIFMGAFVTINKEKNEIIVPAFTFVATVSAIISAGYKPVFVDVKLNNGTKTFLLKYGFNPRFFRKYYLKGNNSIIPYNGSLGDPKLNFLKIHHKIQKILQPHLFN